METANTAQELLESEFVENRRLALVCVDHAQQLETIKAALVALGYTVHLATEPVRALESLRQNRYDMVILHEEYGGSAEHNLVLQTIQPMAMALRRYLCVGLIGRHFRTFDHMMAFVKSVNFVVAERELSKMQVIVQQAVSEHEQFYRVFLESLREAGKPV
jgi:DNA-binding NtrC family response regulator